MATVKLERFLDDVMPDVPGCDLPIALHAIRNSAIEFCERTGVIKTELDTQTVKAGERIVDIDSPSSLVQIVKVQSARMNGTPITPATEDQLDAWDPAWRTKTGTVYHYTQQTPYQLLLAYTPNADMALDLTVSTSPRPVANAVDQLLYDKFREAIGYGARYRLKALRNKPWSDAEGAIYYQNRFNFEIGAAQMSAAKGFNRAALRVSVSY